MMKQDYIDHLANEIKLKVSEPLKSSNKHQDLECLLCNNVFNATPMSKVANFKKHGKSGCPKCSTLLFYKNIDDKNKLKLEQTFEILSDYGDNNYCDLTVRNKTCGHIFTSRKGNLLNRGVICPVCNTDRKRKFYQDINEETHINSLSQKTGFPKYKQLVYKLTREEYKRHLNIINPSNLPRVRSKQDAVGYHLDHIVSVRYCFDNDIPAEICANYQNMRMVEWKSNAKKWKKPVVQFPAIFYPYVPSATKSDEFIDIINSNIPNMFTKYYNCDSYCLTLYSDKLKIGLFYISLNDFKEQYIGSKYHFSKMKKYFQSIGINVLFIFEDEWKMNAQLIIDKIKHYCKLSDILKIHARKCNINIVSNEEKTKFLKCNHIQGSSNSEINIGAYYNNELVALMTFCNPRIIMNKSMVGKKDYWELGRFATSSKYHVVGIASKLLKYFENNYNWKQIYSFADKRWSNGNVYYKLGFDLKVDNPPNYFYIVNNERQYRWGYRKDALKEKFKNDYNSNLTEYQNMLNFGYDRIWDCGTLKFIKENPQL